MAHSALVLHFTDLYVYDPEAQGQCDHRYTIRPIGGTSSIVLQLKVATRFLSAFDPDAQVYVDCTQPEPSPPLQMLRGGLADELRCLLVEKGNPVPGEIGYDEDDVVRSMVYASPGTCTTRARFLSGGAELTPHASFMMLCNDEQCGGCTSAIEAFLTL